MNNEVLLSIAGIGVLGVACQWISWWTKLPAILFLLLCGIFVGPITRLINPDELFQDILFPAVSLSVAVILFEGSLTLKFEELKGLGKVVRNLITIGALVTWSITTFSTHYLMGFSLELSCLFGAVVVVTGPTVIMPMLRSVRPNANISNILRWEGIVIDPLGALLAVLVFEFIISRQSGHAIETVLFTFGKIIIVGSVTGYAAAQLLGYILRNHLIPEYLRNIFSLILVFAVFTFSDLVEHESGLLAVTIMGIALANMKDTNIEDILNFKESLSLLLISGLFIILAARIELHQLYQLGAGSMVVMAVLMLFARPVSVFVSSLGSDLTLSEKIMVSWIGPRGIVAAAVSSIFALRLEEAGYPDAVLLVPLTFLVIIGTVIVQSATSRFFAQLLKVREPPPTGVLIIGAGIVARSIGKAIQENGFKVLLTDSNWENTSLARMEGLPVYYGNPISEHAESHLDLVGLGRMLALSGRSHLDTLASLRFKTEFGEMGVYELKTSREKHISEKHKISTRHRGYELFGEETTHGLLATWLREGAEIRSTQLGEEFSFEDYLEKNRGNIIPLFAIDNRKKLQFFVVNGKMKPEAGWTIISLKRPDPVSSESGTGS